MNAKLIAAMELPTRDQLLTSAEVSRLLRVHQDTVDDWRKQGKIQHVKLGYRTIRFRTSEVARIMNQDATNREARKTKRELPAISRPKRLRVKGADTDSPRGRCLESGETGIHVSDDPFFLDGPIANAARPNRPHTTSDRFVFLSTL